MEGNTAPFSINMRNIHKRFYIGQPNELEILKGIDLQVRQGEFVSIVGASGSGKSTLMNIIGALDRATEGEYELDGVPMNEVPDDMLSEIRCYKIGFVFQTFNLIPRTTALSNVALPMLYSGVSAMARSRRAKALLELVGMGERMKHKPNELSGGQKQRVAIARAMANTGRIVMDLFHNLHEKQGKTIILITHNPELAQETQRIITISDGQVIREEMGDGRPCI